MPQRSLALLLACTLILAGCVKIRLLTYPAEFIWLETSELEGVMHDMAVSLGKIDQLMTDAENSDTKAGEQAKVLQELDKLDALAGSLSTGASVGANDQPASVTNHPLVDEHIDQLIEQIMRARLQVQAQPPVYYAIGQLSGSCNACHRLR